MPKPLKVSAWILGGLALLIVVLGTAVLIVGNTQVGRGVIETLTERLTGGHVKVSGLAGSFPSHLFVAELQLRDGRGVWLTAERIAVDWSPLTYLQGRLQVDNLQVAQVDMQRLPQSSSPSSSGEVSIPRIDVVRTRIERLQLGADLAGAPASLLVSGSAHLRSLRDMRFEATAHRIDGDGDYALQLQFDAQRMDANMKLHEPASGPLENILSLPGLGALDATLSLHGPRSAEQGEMSLQAGALQGHAQGSINLSGLSADLDFNFESSAMTPRPDLSWDKAVLRGHWQGSLKTPTAQGHLDVTGLRIPVQIQLSALSADVSADAGKAAVHARIEGLRVPGRQPRLLETAPLTIDASARLDDPARRVDLTASHKLFSLRAQAVTAGTQSAGIELRVPDLAPLAALTGPELRGSALITAQLDGYPAAPRVKLDATADLLAGSQFWAAAVGNRAKLQATATFKDQTLFIEASKFSGQSISVSATGAASEKSVKFRWEAQSSDLSVFSPILAGTAKASGSLAGATAALEAEALMSADVSVRGSPSGALSAAVKLSGLPAAPSGTLTAHGEFDGAPLQIDVGLPRSDPRSLHVVIHQANWRSARVEGDLSLDTAKGQWHGQADAAVANLGDLQHLLGIDIAGGLKSHFALRPEGQRTRAQLQLDATDVALADLMGNVHLSGDGFTDAFGFNAAVQMPNLSGAAASLKAAGKANFEAREISLASASITYRDQEARLLSPARIDFANGISVDSLKLGAQKAELIVQGQFQPTLALHVSLRGVGPPQVNAVVPNFLASGLIEGHADLRGTVTSPVGDMGLVATGMRRADDAALGLPLADLRVTAALKGHTADINARLDAGPGSRLTAAGEAPLALDGAIDMKINGDFDIAMINPFLEARGLHATGQLDLDASVTGSVAAPQIGGAVNLSKGSLRDYGRGISFSDVVAQLEGSEGTLRIKSFTASAAPGTLAVSGSIGVLQPGIPVDLKITARNAQPIVSKLVTSNLDADVHVSGTARERLDIAGSVHLHRTLIGIPNSLPPEVAVLDVRRRGKQAAPVAAKPLIIGLDLTVQAPQEILVQGRGLDAEMGGEVHFGGTTETPLVNGDFDLLRGNFSLGGSRLNFTAGRVGFNGLGLQNKIDPTLDFTAQATVADNTTATLHITGLADAPIFEFTSNPPRPPDDIMALLLFGVPANQLTAMQLAQIGYALASLGGVGGDGGLNPLVKMQKSLGLDRLTIGSGTTTTNATGTGTDSSGASIEAGRYISKHIYIEAKQTTAGTSQLGADVDLTKHLKLQTRLGNGTASIQGTTPENDPGSSIGLLYQIEY